VKLSDHTHITYLVSASLASCNLKNGFRRFAPHIIRNNNQFSTPYKENACRHSLQSLALILLQRSFDSCGVKTSALNQKKNTNVNAYRYAGNCPYSQNFGPQRNRGALGCFQSNGKSTPAFRVHVTVIWIKQYRS